MAEEPVVVHFTDGRTLAGHADEPVPGQSEVRVRDAASGREESFSLRDIKVICFVRRHGTTGVVRNREAPPLYHTSESSRRVELLFKDGERLSGTVSEVEHPQVGFFVTPLNPNANNRKLYVNPAELVSLRFIT